MPNEKYAIMDNWNRNYINHHSVNFNLFELEVSSMTRDEITEIIEHELMSTNEVAEYLSVSVQAVRSMVKRGKLVPLKDDGHVCLFWRKDIEQRKQESETLRPKYRPYE
jgi:excisionase family DNA binding protein